MIILVLSKLYAFCGNSALQRRLSLAGRKPRICPVNLWNPINDKLIWRMMIRRRACGIPVWYQCAKDDIIYSLIYVMPKWKHQPLLYQLWYWSGCPMEWSNFLWKWFISYSNSVRLIQSIAIILFLNWFTATISVFKSTEIWACLI